MPLSLRSLLLLLTFLLWPVAARADEKLAGLACRSVHLGYPAPEGSAFYCEAVPEQSAPGTYFMVCGFNVGYFGFQELGDGRKLVLFSVWDPGDQNDPAVVVADRQVQAVFHDPQVRVKRFGGEGTGGQSFFDYDWKPGQRLRFLVTSGRAGDRSEFTGWFWLPESDTWKRLVTFSTVATKHQLRGCYSFVEDFQRNRVSATRPRVARFGNGWVRDLQGAWQPLHKARFTGDANPATNIDSGLRDDWFFLATGGETRNEHTQLNAVMERPARDGERVPQDVADLVSPAAK